MVYRELYRRGTAQLHAAGIEEADLEARLLLEYVCGTARNDLLAHGDRIVSTEQESAYQELLNRRGTRIPLQYLTGVQVFMGLEFTVNEHVLIPRQDTEILVEEVLRHLHDGMRILDLCTGSGCILVSLLHYSNYCQGVGTDISGEALDVAAENVRRLLSFCADTKGSGKDAPEECPEGSVSLLCGDLFEHVSGKFDVIVSNPPYISREVISGLMPEVRDHEPNLALDGGEDGLAFYRRIVDESRDFLFGGGMLFLEIGYDQGSVVRDLMEQVGFLEVQVVKDYAGLDRVVYGTRCFAC